MTVSNLLNLLIFPNLSDLTSKILKMFYQILIFQISIHD